MKNLICFGALLLSGANVSAIRANDAGAFSVQSGWTYFSACPASKSPACSTDTVPVSVKDSAKIARNRLRFFQLGLALGPDLVSISVQNKADSLSMTKRVEAHSTLGFHAGLAFRMNFRRWFYLNTQPQFNFQAANLSYDAQGVRAKTSIAPLTLEIPVHFVFKTYQYKLNPAFFIGARYIGDVSESSLNNPVNLKKGEAALEAGAGVEIRFSRRFVFIPSIGAVIGTGNLLQDGLGSLSSVIENVHRTKIEIHFVFF